MTSSSHNDLFMDDDRFDGLYLNVASATKGIEPLLDTVFSFLRRKTDFFSGGVGGGNDINPEDTCKVAIDKVHEVLKKHVDVYVRQKKQQQKKVTNKKTTSSQQPSAKTSVTKGTVTPATTSSPKNMKTDDDIIEMSTDGGFDLSSSSNVPGPEADIAKAMTVDENTTITTPTAEDTNTNNSINSAVGADDDDKNDDNDNTKKRGPPPLGNGGMVEGKYTWTQTLSEVVVSVPVPNNTRGKDLNVVITKTHLKVQLRSNNNILIDDPLTKPIICDDSFWTVEDMNRLVLNLQKVNTMEWWDSVCIGHPTIDIKDIQPENSSLSDLDGETRQTVEKMMFDQRQRALGKPTADEQSKLDMLEKFKLQHPELDFSNAKIS